MIELLIVCLGVYACFIVIDNIDEYFKNVDVENVDVANGETQYYMRVEENR